jgi:hypothetical protein
LLEHLLVAEGPGEVPEDIFASKLTLAGHCLATHPTIQNISLWETIPDLLFKQLLQTDYALTRQHAAETLAEIGQLTVFKKVGKPMHIRQIAKGEHLC